MPLFEVAIIELETKKNVDEGMPAEKGFCGPFTVLAKDADMAKLQALKDVKAGLDFNHCKVLVRPFV